MYEVLRVTHPKAFKTAVKGLWKFHHIGKQTPIAREMAFDLWTGNSLYNPLIDAGDFESYHLAKTMQTKNKGGAHSTIQLWTHRNSNFKVITKSVNAVDLEWYILRSLGNHTNIVQYYGVHHINDNTIRILLENCELGDLTKLRYGYDLQRKPVPEIIVWRVFIDIATALAYCHHARMDKVSLLHTDLKPENIFVQNDSATGLPLFKLGDFGMSRFVYADASPAELHFNGGTHDFQPPELPILGMPADVWALGAVIHDLCLHEPPIDTTKDTSKFSRKDKYRDWIISLPRSSLPINIPPQRRKAQWPKDLLNAGTSWGGIYSNLLNYYLQKALIMDPVQRPAAWQLAAAMGNMFNVVLTNCDGDMGKFDVEVRKIQPVDPEKQLGYA